MKIVDLIQGSDEWKLHRAAHFNASDAPAMMGVSKYKTRSKLLKEMATGIYAEIDVATQRRFDDGHRFEALARPIAEIIIGDDLSPVVGVSGKLSASFDGITFDESFIFEHKTLNASLRNVTCTDDLDEQYRVQMEQQLLVSGAGRCLFMASKWDGDELSEPAMHVWYLSDEKLRARIVAGWEQFAVDLANYQHVESKPEVIAAPVQELPALSIQVNGSISLISNLQKFGARLNEFVSAINKEPNDDQGFADAEQAIKILQRAQDELESSESDAMNKIADIDDMRKTVAMYADIARTTRLLLEKMVKARKESIRIEIVQAAKNKFVAHTRALEVEINPIELMIATPDFATAIKGKKSIASIRESADTALRNGMIEADDLAADIRAKLGWYKETLSSYEFLFRDLQTLITNNGMEAFQSIVRRRIDDHKAAESAKFEAQRIAMQAEAEAKAKAEQEAIIAAERIKMEAESKAKIAAEVKAYADHAAEVLHIETEKNAAAKVTEDAANAEANSAQRTFNQTGIPIPPDVENGRMVSKVTEAQQIEERRRVAQCDESALRLATVTQIKPVETVTIPKAEYERLLKSDEWLECLEAAGVDNWSGFDEARAIFNSVVA